MSSTLADATPLSEHFALTREGDDLFRVTFEDDQPGPAFGAAILGCATRAGAFTVDDRPLTSLHMRFLRPVAKHQPVALRVERTRDGRRFSHRRICVEVAGKLCCEVTLSFASPMDGADLAGRIDPSELPRPGELPSEEEVALAKGWEQYWQGPFEWRWIGDIFSPKPGDSSRYRAWVRPRVPLGEERALYAAAIAYLADFHAHFSVARLRERADAFENPDYTSLDTVIWLHRDLPWTDWRLLETECDVGHASRALTRRRLYHEDGRLIVSMAQEALILAG